MLTYNIMSTKSYLHGVFVMIKPTMEDGARAAALNHQEVFVVHSCAGGLMDFSIALPYWISQIG